MVNNRQEHTRKTFAKQGADVRLHEKTYLAQRGIDPATAGRRAIGSLARRWRSKLAVFAFVLHAALNPEDLVNELEQPQHISWAAAE